MSRRYARVLIAVWDPDGDFPLLPSAAQHMYFALMSHPRITYAGVLDYNPKRLATIAPDLTPAKVDKACRTLADARFVVIDDNTDELLIRTFVRHDNVMQQRNVGKAFGAAYGRVVSPMLRDVIVTELRKVYADTSTMQGWQGLREIHPRLHALAQGLET